MPGNTPPPHCCHFSVLITRPQSHESISPWKSGQGGREWRAGSRLWDELSQKPHFPTFTCLVSEISVGLLAGWLSQSEQAQSLGIQSPAALRTWAQGGGAVVTATVSKRHAVLRPLGLGFSLEGAQMGGGWVGDSGLAPMAQGLLCGCGSKEEMSGWREKQEQGPPWEEEMDKATSLGPQECQAPGLEQLS